MRSLFRKIREANRPFCTALVAAAGSSSRMGGTDKLMEFLDNVPVLMRTLTALQRAEPLSMRSSLPPGRTHWWTSRPCARPTALRNAARWCGAVRAGVIPCCWRHWKPPRRRSCWRCRTAPGPLVTPALIDRTVEAAAKCGAAAPAVPVKDTIKTVAEDGAVTGTPDRSTLAGGADAPGV